MEDPKSKQKSKEIKSHGVKNSPRKKLKHPLPKSKLTANTVSKNKFETIENEKKYVKSKFSDKLKIIKDSEIDDLNKVAKEDNFKRYLSFNSNKKNIQNSLSQDLISKILEINYKESSIKNDSSNLFLHKKEEAYINSKMTNGTNANNHINMIEYKEESKSSIKKSENNKIQEKFSHKKNKNIRKNLSKNKNNIKAIRGAGTQDFKFTNLKLDSSNTYTEYQSDNGCKYNSSIADNMVSHLKKTDILFGLHQLSKKNTNQQLTFRVFSQNNIANVPSTQRSNLKNIINNESKYNILKRQKEIAQSLIDLDLVKLQKEVYDYENTDVTDAINRLPTHKFDSGKNNNKNKLINKNKNNKKEKSKKYKNNIKEKFRILTRVKYVYDSLDDEECEDDENNFYFEPNGNFILILDFVVLVISLFYLIFLPIYLSSSSFNEKNLIKDLVFIFIDIIFIIDFISGFFKAYINFDEDLVKNSVSIIQNYLKTWFLLDFLCSIPVDSILKALKNKFEVNNNNNKNYFIIYNERNFYRLFGLIKLLKIIKVFKANIAEKKIKRTLKKISFFYYWWHLIKQIFIFISILNLSSCLFIFSAQNSYPNWILNLNMNRHNFINIYICSFYYIITTVTTVGYGDIQIFSMAERIFEILFLIIGTCLYSWILTSASNYIQKISEKNIKFEQKIEILDEIKSNYPIMSKDLYRKIYKLLHYKNSHQEVDKNVIIDSLPYSIRNNLLIQMYYPIITNFKFFKYFGNSEFIIEIVSVLKPLVSMKGDFLINEGDYVEDIILNKSGILSIEIYIDLNNPLEFIEQYLTKYNLENIKNQLNFYSNNNEFSSAYRINSFNSSNYTKNTHNIYKINNSTIRSNMSTNIAANLKYEKSTFDNEKINKNNLHSLKILNIREKEHFGDVLMFLNEPSPLNVRVSSKNAELLLLSKTDVVKISSNFPNIWKRINESSIFNLEQIKILIMRKLSVFCFSNDIKIKSLFYKKDTITHQNKINYSLIPIPDNPNQIEKLNQSANFNESDFKSSKNSLNNSSQISENLRRKNNYTIKEEQSSEEKGSNNMSTKKIKYSYKNCAILKKGTSKKTSDSNSLSNQREFSDGNIFNKENNEYSVQNIIENQNQFTNQSRRYSNLCQKKNSIFSSKHAENLTKTAIFKMDMNIDNKTNNENFSYKNSKRNNLNNSPILNSAFNASVIYSPIYQNFAEKSRINKRLISIPTFNFMHNHNNNNLNSESDNVNDEIYPNENFKIIIPDNDKSLIINNYIDSKENSLSNYHESPKNLLISGKKNFEINKSNNSNNKFNDLKISSMSSFELKSSYDNINEFTNYKFISNKLLIEKTKIFLSKECGLLHNVNTKRISTPYYFPNHDRETKSNSTLKLPKYSQNKKCYNSTNRITNLSVINDNNASPLSPFSKKLKKSIKLKNDNEKFKKYSLRDIKSLNKSFAHIKRNSTIKTENKMPQKGNIISKNMINSFIQKKGERKSGVSLDNLVNIKTKNKLDLISENMKRDNQNLNNPNEFYADLFHVFIKKNKNNESKRSILKIKETQNDKEKENSEKNKEVEKENNLNVN